MLRVFLFAVALIGLSGTARAGCGDGLYYSTATLPPLDCF